MKNKTLFIVSDFYHGGAQREMYEIDCTLNKSNTDVSILSLKDLNQSAQFSDHFYNKHLEKNTNVYFLKSILKDRNKFNFNKVAQKLKIVNHNAKNSKLLLAFFQNYSNVFFMGEYVYKSISHFIPKNYFKQINIFIMCARFQGEQYRDFSKDNSYLFITPFDDEKQVDYEFEGFKDYEHKTFPLSFDIDLSYLRELGVAKKTIKKIGIFTRLSKAKPLDPFFYSLHLILKQMPDVELHVFGSGDFKEAGFDKYLNHLHLQDKVFFRGHQENIKKSCFDENLDLIWFQGYKNRPAGYAGLDLCLTGVPLLLWDFYFGVNPNANKLEYIYPHFNSIDVFVESSIKVLQDINLAKQISKRQLNDVVSNRDIKKNIKTIETIFE